MCVQAVSTLFIFCYLKTAIKYRVFSLSVNYSFLWLILSNQKMGRLSAINCSFVCFFVTRLGIFLNTISNSDSLFSQNFYFQKNRLSLSTGYCKTRIGCQRWLETLLEHVNLQIFQSDCGYSIVDSF